MALPVSACGMGVVQREGAAYGGYTAGTSTTTCSLCDGWK